MVKGTLQSCLFVYLLSLVLMTAGCKADTPEDRPGDGITAAPAGRIISGEEALRLYGIGIQPEVEGEGVFATPEPWFPMEVWVSASVLPYEDPDPIYILPVYADSELGVQSTWVGDLKAGKSVMLLSVHPDGHACFVEGSAVQGWSIKGWVACNRLLFAEPTPVVTSVEEGAK
jgi:hypothetical protein